jgi:hypothetical protein
LRNFSAPPATSRKTDRICNKAMRMHKAPAAAARDLLEAKQDSVLIIIIIIIMLPINFRTVS